MTFNDQSIVLSPHRLYIHFPFWCGSSVSVATIYMYKVHVLAISSVQCMVSHMSTPRRAVIQYKLSCSISSCKLRLRYVKRAYRPHEEYRVVETSVSTCSMFVLRKCNEYSYRTSQHWLYWLVATNVSKYKIEDGRPRRCRADGQVYILHLWNTHICQ